jgi:hypothetical protein
MKGYSSRAFLSNYTAIADSKWWRKLTDTNENQLHWILDVGFREDDARATQGYSAENLAVIRHLAVNLLTQEKTAKGGTHAKRLKAGWNDRCLTKVLSQPSAPARKL